MNRTSIEWVKNPDGSQGYTWNPITGCLNQVNGLCQGGGFPCYAYRLAHGRLQSRYLSNTNIGGEYHEPMSDRLKDFADPFYPRFWPDKLDQPLKRKKPAGIFTCDMSDLFGIGVPEQWTWSVLNFIKECPQHRFYLLTKQPQNLAKFSPFPDNCWVGVTATNYEMFNDAVWNLINIEAKVKYLSLEPLLALITAGILAQYHNWPVMHGSILHNIIDWIIIGAQTKPAKKPELQWVKDIIKAADTAGIPVFLKDSLYKLAMDRPVEDHDLYWEDMSTLRQELPDRRVAV